MKACPLQYALIGYIRETLKMYCGETFALSTSKCDDMIFTVQGPGEDKKQIKGSSPCS